jgi:hypothetical protein
VTLVPMSEDAARAALFEVLPFASGDDLQGFLEASVDDQTLILTAFKEAGSAPSDAGTKVLAILRACAPLAKYIPGVGEALGVVFGIVDAAGG